MVDVTLGENLFITPKHLSRSFVLGPKHSSTLSPRRHPMELINVPQN